MRHVLLFGLLALAGCATSADVPAALSQPVDSAVQDRAAQARARALVAQLSTGKVKFNGPVVFQIGGTSNSASSTSAPKAKAPVAAGPASAASETRTGGGTPWYVLAGLAALGLAGGFALRGKWRLPV